MRTASAIAAALVASAALCAAVSPATAAPTSPRAPIEGGAATVVPRHEWTEAAMASSTALAARPLELIFALKHDATGLATLERLTLEAADPDNAERYGKWMSHDEVNALVAPPQRAVDAVVAWLRAEGTSIDGREPAVSVSPAGDFVTVRTTVAIASRLLDARYVAYEHNTADASTVRLASGTGYTLPAGVAEHVAFVSPTVRFPRAGTSLPPKTTTTPVEALNPLLPEGMPDHDSAQRVGNGSLFIVPSYLRRLYRAENASGTPGNGNTMCVASFIQQFYVPSDLAEFYGLFAPALKNHSIVKQIGKNDPTNPGAEAELDVQYLSSVGQGVDTWVWYTANKDTPFLTWLVNVSSTPDSGVPKLFSVSYGEYENGDTVEYMTRTSAEFAKLAARGVSVFLAAGDNGAGGNCTGDRTSPDFPASSPWVTAVGGVMGGDADKLPCCHETADYIGGGGFSDTFARPAWQDAAVEAYLSNSTGMPAKKDFNASGRSYPDTAAQSEAFTIVLDGIPLMGTVSGTSCATPTVAGIFGLLNDIRISAGKAPLGFLNPLIYKLGDTAFNDVTTGANAGCDVFGFPARPSWDAATGWGSPNYQQLAKAVEALP